MESESGTHVRPKDKAPCPANPVHTALSVPELLIAIFSWLSRADLTKVARVCRLWSPLALDRIWENIPDLKYLIHTYSPLKLLGISVDGIGVWKFQDISAGARWDVLWAYARRVRTVEAGNAVYTKEITEHLKSQAERYLDGSCLLPNLRSLSLRVSTNNLHLIEAWPMIPPGLRALQVYIWPGVRPSTIQRLLSRLTVIPMDQLSYLDLDGRVRIDSDESLSRCRADFLQPLSSTLTYLNIFLFPLTGEELERIGEFPRVTRLAVEQRGTCDDLDKFFAKVASSFPNLCAINVVLDGTIKEDVSISVVGGLERCKNLLNIHLGCSSCRLKPLTDADVRQLGRRWPLMEKFCIHQHRQGVGTPLGILQDFAQVWSQTLRKLVLHFDTATALPKAPFVQYKFKRLKTLSVGHSILEARNVEDVVEFFTAILPGPVVFFYSYEGRSKSHFYWGAVKDRVQARWL